MNLLLSGTGVSSPVVTSSEMERELFYTDDMGLYKHHVRELNRLGRITWRQRVRRPR
jgi:hypothetical protein